MGNGGTDGMGYGQWAQGAMGTGGIISQVSSVTHCPCGPYPPVLHTPCTTLPLWASLAMCPIPPCTPLPPVSTLPIAPITNITHYPMGTAVMGNWAHGAIVYRGYSSHGAHGQWGHKGYGPHGQCGTQGEMGYWGYGQ